MERSEMIELLLGKAGKIVDDYVYDATSVEKESLLNDERARLDKLEDRELAELVKATKGGLIWIE